MKIISLWKKISLVCMIGILLMLVTGCNSVSDEEKSELEETKEKAAIYYNGKYDLDETVEDYDYDFNEGLFGPAYNTETMYFEMSDGYVVIYDVSKDRLFDNRQSQKIVSDINNIIMSGIFAEVEAITGQQMYCEKPEAIKYNHYGAGGDRVDDFFTQYYDGDIENYLAKEDVELYSNMSDMIIVCDDDSWTEAVEYMENEIKENFAEYKLYWDVEILTSELYEKYKGNFKDYRGSLYGFEGYIARVRMENVSGVSELAIDKPTYIQVCPGVYMTSDEFDFAFLYGDVKLEVAMTGDELEKYSDSVLITVEGTVYKATFSERVNAYLKTKDKGFLTVYCKFVPEEFEVSTTKEFCELANGVTDKDVSVKDFHGIEWTENLKIAHYMSICDDDLYFFGEYEAVE